MITRLLCVPCAYEVMGILGETRCRCTRVMHTQAPIPVADLGWATVFKRGENTTPAE